MALPELIHLGPVLKRFRRLRDLRQRHVEERTGYARSRISAYENGRTLPGLPSLWALIDLYGSSLGELERFMREQPDCVEAEHRSRAAKFEAARQQRDEVGHLIDWLLEHEP